MAGQARDAVVGYPGGLRVRYRWAGSAAAADVFALTEFGGTLADHGPLVAAEPDLLCRAELRADGPAGSWTVRLASPIYDEPTGVLWDTAGQLVVGYGFHSYGLNVRTGTLRWHHRSGSPLVAVLASSRLDHVLVQSEIETFAIEADGGVAWRAVHSDVVAAATLVAGRLILTSYAGLTTALDPATGRSAG